MTRRIKKEENERFAYFIEDKYFGKLHVRKSANAWWMDRGKVERLVTGYKLDCKPAELRILAGISKDQLEYFKEQHPEFSSVLEDLRKVPTIKARTSLVRALESDPNLALKYMERKEADEFKEQKQVDVNLPNLLQNIFPIEEKRNGGDAQ